MKSSKLSRALNTVHQKTCYKMIHPQKDNCSVYMVKIFGSFFFYHFRQIISKANVTETLLHVPAYRWRVTWLFSLCDLGNDEILIC